MAIDKKPTDPTDPKDTTRKASDPQAPPPAMYSPGAVLTSPIVLTLDKKGKKNKKRYTSGTKATQRFLYGLARAGYRTGDSVSKGFRTFVRRSDRSAKRRKDGMIRDSLRNASRGYGRALSTLGRAPNEIASRISTRAIWRTFRVLMPPFGN